MSTWIGDEQQVVFRIMALSRRAVFCYVMLAPHITADNVMDFGGKKGERKKRKYVKICQLTLPRKNIIEQHTFSACHSLVILHTPQNDVWRLSSGKNRNKANYNEHYFQTNSRIFAKPFKISKYCGGRYFEDGYQRLLELLYHSHYDG